MPDQLSHFQIEHFKTLLHQRLALAKAEIRELLAPFAFENGDNPLDAIARAAFEAWEHGLADFSADKLNRYLDEIADLQSALTRIAEQQFGICAYCNEPIQFKRLLSYPTAKRCAVCQRLYEIEKPSPDDCN